MPTTDEILEYVKRTPENTNIRVLKDMLENNNSSNGLIVHKIDSALDHTWKEIENAAPFVILDKENNEPYYALVFMSPYPSVVIFVNANQELLDFICESEEDYPYELS